MKNLKNRIKNFIKSEKGDLSVKGIAITIAIVIIIGAAATFISQEGNFFTTAVSDAWDFMFEKIKDTFQ